MSKLKSPINVLYLITDLKYGGAQTVLMNLLEQLDTNHFQAQVVCLFGGSLPIGDELRARGIKVTDLQMTHPWRLDSLWRFYRLLKREKITILHTSLFHASLVGRLIGGFSRIPVILTWRHNVSLGAGWRDLINRWTSKLDDCVVVVSEPARQAELRTSGIPQDKIQLIYNAIDIGRYSQITPEIRKSTRESFGIANGTFLIGFVGRLHPQKGVEILLEAFARCHPEHKNSFLLIVGEGELQNRLEAYATSLGITNQILFLGSRKEIPEILVSLDLFVLPSLWEGLPMVLLEAMAAGLPVIATSVGGTPEVVVDGTTGYLVPPEDADKLATAILQLAENPELRMNFGKAGRARVEKNFSIREMVKKIEQLYRDLLALKGLDA